ncbi:MAG TPA: DUF4065 domain-containing protein [Polyangium sp.]|nr:DUF4065 domain-containing protein [Polyangium sp.]
MQPSLALTRWIHDHYPYGDALTHLKVQKLLFYCVGAAMAFDREHELGGEVVFQPWEHGPVNESVWHELKDFRGGAIPETAFARHGTRAYPEDVELPMKWALQIYGALDAWKLRQQSHMEQPWIDAYAMRQHRICPQVMKTHFKQKFAGQTVYAPEHLQDPGTFTLDYLPVIGYESMKDLAESIHLIYGQ